MKIDMKTMEHKTKQLSWYERNRKVPDGIRMCMKDGRMYEKKGFSKRLFWSPQMLHDLRTMYPVTLNEELAGMLGVSIRTLIRKARELGVEKDKTWLGDVWEKHRIMAHDESRRRGYPGGFKKGEHVNPDGEFKHGHSLTDEQEQKRRESLRKSWIKRKRK